MKPIVIKNALSESEIADIQSSIALSPDVEEQSNYGRYMYHGVIWKNDNTFQSTMLHKVGQITNNGDWMIVGAACARYTADAGDPNLPPHFDGDSTDMIATIQIESNKTWGVGVDLEVYEIEDSDAVLFHPNESIHWRPHADFQDGEYVLVMFMRFKLPKITDYSHKRYSQDDPIFDEVKAYRDSF